MKYTSMIGPEKWKPFHELYPDDATGDDMRCDVEVIVIGHDVVCVRCRLVPRHYSVRRRSAMIAHLEDHRAQGWHVPDHVFKRLA